MRSECNLRDAASATIEQYGMLVGGERLVVAVSGGPDSVALLLFLHDIAESMRLELSVFHLDHMLRGEESAADARFVEELARCLDVPVRSVAVDVRSEAGESGRSPQDAARRVRLGLLESFAEEIGADRIATGHNADDQVETFLMRVIQGAGLTGLAGIPPVSMPFIRPLINVRRHEIEEYCASMGVTPRNDSSNLDRSYLRNHVRHSMVPFMAVEFGEAVKDVILREVESLAIDRDYMLGQSVQAFEAVGRASDDEIRLSVEGLSSLHPAMQRCVVREAWRRLMPDEPNLAWRHVVDVLEKVAAGNSGAKLDLPGPVTIEREYGELVMRLVAGVDGVSEGEAFIPATLEVPGSVAIPGAGVVIEARVVARDEVAFDPSPDAEYIRPDAKTPLEVRAPRPGDRFRPLGAPGARKLKDFFIDEKLPRARRKLCPVILSGGEGVWVAGHRLDERFRLRHEDTEAIMLIMRPPG